MEEERPVTSDGIRHTEALVRRFQEGLAQFVLRRVPSEADAADVLQEIFLRIHQGAARIEYDDQVAGWIYTVARRTIADFYRDRYRRLDDRPVDEAPPPEAPPPEGSLVTFAGSHDVHEEVLSWLRPMIEGLPEPYRTALLLADVEGLPQQAIADRSGITLSGAKSRVQRARQMLGEALRRCCEVEFGPDGRAIEFRRVSSRCADGC